MPHVDRHGALAHLGAARVCLALQGPHHAAERRVRLDGGAAVARLRLRRPRSGDETFGLPRQDVGLVRAGDPRAAAAQRPRLRLRRALPPLVLRHLRPREGPRRLRAVGRGGGGRPQHRPHHKPVHGSSRGSGPTPTATPAEPPSLEADRGRAARARAKWPADDEIAEVDVTAADWRARIAPPPTRRRPRRAPTPPTSTASTRRAPRQRRAARRAAAPRRDDEPRRPPPRKTLAAAAPPCCSQRCCRSRRANSRRRAGRRRLASL